MYSRQEAQKIKTEFWTTFGRAFPRKWLLYDTKIKDFSFKFYADNKKAEVALEIGMKDETLSAAYFAKVLSLENFLLESIGRFDSNPCYPLENGKFVSKIWVEKNGVSIFNKNSWRDIFEFFVQKMSGFEQVFFEFEDYIKNV